MGLLWIAMRAMFAFRPCRIGKLYYLLLVEKRNLYLSLKKTAPFRCVLRDPWHASNDPSTQFAFSHKQNRKVMIYHSGIELESVCSFCMFSLMQFFIRAWSAAVFWKRTTLTPTAENGVLLARVLLSSKTNILFAVSFKWFFHNCSAKPWFPT